MFLFPKARNQLSGSNILDFVFLRQRMYLLHLGVMLIALHLSIMKYKNKLRTYEGIRYKSALEVTCAMLLAEHGIPFQYEPEEFILVESGTYPGIVYEKKTIKKKKVYGPSKGSIRKISYTPDFMGKGWIIETKGFETSEFKLKWKLFQHELIKRGQIVHLFKPTNKREILETIQLIKNLDNGSKKVAKNIPGTGEKSQEKRRNKQRRTDSPVLQRCS